MKGGKTGKDMVEYRKHADIKVIKKPTEKKNIGKNRSS